MALKMAKTSRNPMIQEVNKYLTKQFDLRQMKKIYQQ